MFLQYQSAQDNSLLKRIFLLCNYFSIRIRRENTSSTQVFCHFFLLLYSWLLFDSVFIRQCSTFYCACWLGPSLMQRSKQSQIYSVSWSDFYMYESKNFTSLRGEVILSFLNLFLNNSLFINNRFFKKNLDCSMIHYFLLDLALLWYTIKYPLHFSIEWSALIIICIPG